MVCECCSTPCQNGGQCIECLNGFMCSCPATRAGVFCELESRCVDNPCVNGALCVEPSATGEQATCICLEGFRGARCAVNIDECTSSPCQNGGGWKETGDQQNYYIAHIIIHLCIPCHHTKYHQHYFNALRKKLCEMYGFAH